MSTLAASILHDLISIRVVPEKDELDLEDDSKHPEVMAKVVRQGLKKSLIALPKLNFFKSKP